MTGIRIHSHLREVIFQTGTIKGWRGHLKVSPERIVFRHGFYSWPVSLLRKTENFENTPNLFDVIRIAGFCVLHFAVKDRLVGQQLGEDAANGPNVDRFSVMTSTEQQLWRAVPVSGRKENM